MNCHANAQRRGYKGSDDEQRVEDVRLEGEESQAHVGKDEVLCQEVEQLEQLVGKKQNQGLQTNDTRTAERWLRRLFYDEL